MEGRTSGGVKPAPQSLGKPGHFYLSVLSLLTCAFQSLDHKMAAVPHPSWYVPGMLRAKGLTLKSLSLTQAELFPGTFACIT